MKKYLTGLLAVLVSVGIMTGCQPVVGSNADSVAPTVSSAAPLNAATAVAINTKLTATFNEAMAPSSINDLTFLLKAGTTSVTGVVSYVGLAATFTPAANLASNTLYTATITTGAMDVAGNVLAAPYTWSFTTSAAPDTTAPTVSAKTPAAAAVDVAKNIKPTATFSESMDPATITAATFTLKQGTTAVTGTVAYVGLIATFTPTADLAANTVYTATVTTGAKDLAANALAANYTWSFTTGAALDTTAPTIVSVIPTTGATGVAINSAMSATFSEAMDPLTVTTTTFTLMQGANPVAGTVLLASGGLSATFTPNSNLASGTMFTATITTGAKDLAVPANALAANYVWTFTTSAAPDTTAPTVVSVLPANVATNTSIHGDVVATFSEAMAPATVTTASFKLMQGANPIAGTVVVASNGLSATFNPDVALTQSTVYTATITTGVKDLAVPGNALAADYVWSFTTGIETLAVNLLTAGNFVVLGKSGITNVPPSVVTGDLAISPANVSAITGFTITWDTVSDFTTETSTPTQIVGKVYGVGYTANSKTLADNAIADLGTAFADAAGRAPSYTELYAGDLSGQTLTPGVYKYSNNVLINENLTLTGSATDVWIFQISGDLTMAGAKQVTLSGGAVAKNVFWQVVGPGSGVTIGAGAQFKGVVMCATKIDTLAGAQVVGRLMSQTAVNLISTTLTQPAP